MSSPLRKEREPEANDPLNELQRRRTSRPADAEMDEEERIALVKSGNQDIVENDDIIDGDDITDDVVMNNASGNPQGRNARPDPQSATSRDAPLFPGNELQQLQGRWDKIQTNFVDQPRNAVREADSLVSSARQRLSEVFSAERTKLEQQWDRGDSVSTEDLRIALQRYRSFFRRVLAL